MALADATITVDVHDTLPDVLDRLRQQTGRAARLRVPAGSAVLLTANEFRVLKEAADRDRIQLTLESPDRLRLQLARMFGLPATFPDPAVVTPIRPGVATEPRRPTPATRPPRPSPPRANTPVQPKAARRDAAAPASHSLPKNGATPTARRAASTPTSSPTVVAPGRAPLPNRVPSSEAATASPPESATNDKPLDASLPTKNGTTPKEEKANPKQPAAEIVGGDVPRDILLLAASNSIPTPQTGRRRLGRHKSAKAAPKQAPVAAAVAHRGVAFDVDELDRDEAAAITPRRNRRRLAVIAAAVSIVVILALIAAAVFALPRATIAVTLKQQPVQGELTYQVVSGQSAPSANGGGLVFPATPFAFDVTVTKQIPTTGARLIPVKTAGGTVTFANPAKQPVKLAKGTKLTSDTGVPFVLTEEVTVPAADASGRSGFAQGKVQAANPGGTGNLDTGVLEGKLDTGVYYSNRDGATSGGTDKKVPAVAAADLDTLKSQIAPTLDQTARTASGGKLPAGQSLIDSSLSLGEPSYTFDHKAGDEASELTVTASVHVTGLSYDRAAALAQAKSALQHQLAGGLPAGYILDAGSLQLGEPVETGHDANSASFKVSANGQAHADFSTHDQATLANKLAGKSTADAERVLQNEPAFTAATVSYSPSWFPHRMPRWAKRITFDVKP